MHLISFGLFFFFFSLSLNFSQIVFFFLNLGDHLMSFVGLGTMIFKIFFFSIPYLLSVMHTNLSSLSHIQTISSLGYNMGTWKHTRSFCLLHSVPGLTL